MANLTLRQIKSAIESQIESFFPGIKVHKTGVLNGFDRPSFFVLLNSIESSDQLYYRSRTISVDVHYFPKEKYQYTLELLDTQDQLDSAFGLNITIGGRVITLNDNSSADVVDGVLHFSFSFSYLEDKPQKSEETLMQELDYNG